MFTISDANRLYPTEDRRYDNPKSIASRERRADGAGLPDHDWRALGFENTHVVRIDPEGKPEVFKLEGDVGRPVVAATPLKGSAVGGYIQCTLTGSSRKVSRYLHRIVWDSVMLAPGAHQIDHVDGEGANNRLPNTQPVCPIEQCAAGCPTVRRARAPGGSTSTRPPAAASTSARPSTVARTGPGCSAL